MAARPEAGPEARPRRKRGAGTYLLLALVSLILLVACFYAVRTLSLFVSPMLFLAAVFFEVTSVTLLVFWLLRAMAAPSEVIRSLSASAWAGLGSNPYIVRVRESDSRLVSWTRDRLRRDRASGLWLTATVVVALIPFVNFLGLCWTVATHGSLTQVDERIANLMPMVRTPGETEFFSTITALANFQTVLVLTVLAVALLWWRRQRFCAVFFVAAVAGQELLAAIAKGLIGRPRPALSLALLDEGSFSFPSGHVLHAAVVFGVVAYLLFRVYRTTAAKALTAIAYLLVVLLVAMSRVYLGVHYLTDVWGSMLLGSSFVVVLVGVLEIAARYPVIRGRRRRSTPGRRLLAAPAGAVVFAVVAAPLLIHPQSHPVQQHTQSLATLDASSLARLPIYSETLTGDRMEPVSFVFVGSEDQLVRTFESHGWDRADPSTFANTLRAFAVGFQGGQYPTAPVTPSFLASQPEAIAFQKATAAQSLRQRHHTRIWRTGYTAPDGRPIWEATASFDDGIEFAGTAKLPTHHIDPNIDAERTYIIGSLGHPDRFLALTGPQMGHNASGDEFFTDGRSELVILQ